MTKGEIHGIPLYWEVNEEGVVDFKLGLSLDKETLLEMLDGINEVEEDTQ